MIWNGPMSKLDFRKRTLVQLCQCKHPPFSNWISNLMTLSVYDMPSFKKQFGNVPKLPTPIKFSCGITLFKSFPYLVPSWTSDILSIDTFNSTFCSLCYIYTNIISRCNAFQKYRKIFKIFKFLHFSGL